jgi:hypothetical protein
MTTVTASYHQRSFPTELILLAIIIALAVVSMHALAKHGEAAITASQCADRPELRMFNPENGRIAFICMTSVGKWGVWIVESTGKEVTSFLKEKMKSLEQVIRYMKNAGYELIQ